MARLTVAKRNAALNQLKGWAYEAHGKSIVKQFRFDTFRQAFGFMAEVALIAEKADHHPDWSNSYDRVTISLSTHDAGGVSDKDVALAQAIDAIV